MSLVRNRLLAGWLAALAFLPLAFMPASSSAQLAPVPPGTPVITGFDVQQVQKLVPGATLVFTLRGTPGGVARIAVAGSANQYFLNEIDPGVYQGAYTIRRTDSFDRSTEVQANLRLGNLVATAVLDESLLAGAPWRSAAQRAADVAAASAPRIDRFRVEPVNPLMVGSELQFTLQGTPGAQASVRVNGSQGKTVLTETSPGKYEGSHRIARTDRVDDKSRVTATLRSGNRTVSESLDQSLLAAAPVRAPVRACANCGVVEAINLVDVKGPGSYLGLIAGGVAGAVLGSQVGQGNGRTAAQVIGAAGGAYAGREIEKQIKKTQVWEVVARLEGGGSQTLSFQADPGFKVGERVRVENGTLVHNR
jgi:outer membrane lipoprotein SlyB